MQHSSSNAELSVATSDPIAAQSSCQTCGVAPIAPSAKLVVASPAQKQSPESHTHSQQSHAPRSEQDADMAVLLDDAPPPLARPTHSVWSMSASSGTSSASPSFSATCSQLEHAPHQPDSLFAAAADDDNIDSLTSMPDGIRHTDGLSHFSTGIKPLNIARHMGTAACVTAEVTGLTFDPERFILDSLSTLTLDSQRLIDYSIQEVLCSDGSGCTPAESGQDQDFGGCDPLCLEPTSRAGCRERLHCAGQPWAVVLILALLQPRLYVHSQAVSPVILLAEVCSVSGETVHAWPFSTYGALCAPATDLQYVTSSSSTFIHRQRAYWCLWSCFVTGTAELLSQQWIGTEAFQSLSNSLRGSAQAAMYAQSDLQRLVVVTLAEHQARRLRQKYVAPQSRSRRPVVLNNKIMLLSGRSANLLVHPTLPICILGYN